MIAASKVAHSLLKSKVDKGPYNESYGFSSSHVQMWELDRWKLSAEEAMLSNCGAAEDSWESLEQ